MTRRTVTVPVPCREGDGGTVHKRPQGTVRGRLGTVVRSRPWRRFAVTPGGFHGAAEARRRGVDRGARSGWTFEAFQLLPKSGVSFPSDSDPRRENDVDYSLHDSDPRRGPSKTGRHTALGGAEPCPPLLVSYGFLSARRWCVLVGGVCPGGVVGGQVGVAGHGDRAFRVLR